MPDPEVASAMFARRRGVR